MLNEAKTSRARPELQGLGQWQFLEVEDKAEVKNSYEKYQIIINNIWFKIIAGKINKISEFYTFLPEKCPIT